MPFGVCDMKTVSEGTAGAARDGFGLSGGGFLRGSESRSSFGPGTRTRYNTWLGRYLLPGLKPEGRNRHWLVLKETVCVFNYIKSIIWRYLLSDGVFVEPQTVNWQHKPVFPPLEGNRRHIRADVGDTTLNPNIIISTNLYLLACVQFDHPAFLEI